MVSESRRSPMVLSIRSGTIASNTIIRKSMDMVGIFGRTIDRRRMTSIVMPMWPKGNISVTSIDSYKKMMVGVGTRWERFLQWIAFNEIMNIGQKTIVEGNDQTPAEIPAIVNEVVSAALAAADPVQMVYNILSLEGDYLIVGDKWKFDLLDFRNIYVLGAGKAVVGQLKEVRNILGDRVSGGVVVSLGGYDSRISRDGSPDCDFSHYYGNVKMIHGSHPIPDQRSEVAGKALIQYIDENVKENDLVIFLISGGASSLVVLPHPPLVLEDLKLVNKELLKVGADITEVNCVRKHLSLIKGGRLAVKMNGATLITLVISDIMGSPLGLIGSGLTVPDPTTFKDAVKIIEKYGLENVSEGNILKFLERGMGGEYDDTPKPDTVKCGGEYDEKPIPAVMEKENYVKLQGENNVQLIGENRTVLEAISNIMRNDRLAWDKIMILDTHDGGGVGEAATRYSALMESLSQGFDGREGNILLVGGGEVTVRVKGEGSGGRNQHFVLQMLILLKDIHIPYFVMSFGTDGIDGDTDAAGAWIDHTSWEKAKSIGLDPMNFFERFDSYAFFDGLGQLIKTGPTGTNLMDVRVFLIGDPN